jgi:plastocyanin
MSLRVLAAVTSAVILLTACAKGEKGTAGGDSSQAASTPSASATSPGSPATPAPGRKVIVVELASNEKGNFFEPNEIEAKRGDVIRYTVKIGVHNVHFLPDSNTVKMGLPPASDMLQLPGQTYDLLVNFEPGTYYFQCDPHVALGMKGHLKVED